MTPMAVLADRLGPPETYRFAEYDPGKPEPGAVQIAIHCANVSFADTLIATGQYQVSPPLPFIPGTECAGTIVAIGSSAPGFSVGDHVVASSFGGMFADRVNVAAHAVRRAPASLDFAEAAAFSVSYATAWHALVDRGGLKKGETLLVLGASGATGYAAVQIGHHLGARVIALASTETKRATALAAGAHLALSSRAPDWKNSVRDAAKGGIDVVFDPVGGDSTEAAFRLIAWNGRHLIVGFPAGIASLRTNLALLKGASVVGVDIRQFGQRYPEMLAENYRQLDILANQGILKPHVANRIPLAQFAEAMTGVASGADAGRTVLTMANHV